MILRILSFCLATVAATTVAEPAATKPNIVFILADDLGYGDVQALNPERGKIATPNLDRLVAEGMTFTDAHSGSSVCTPTRYGVLTGRYCWRTRQVSGVGSGVSLPLIADGRATVASFLREQGYRTACIGKWHIGLEWAKWGDSDAQTKHPDWAFDFSKPLVRGPLQCGFDQYFGIAASLDMPPYAFIENDRLTAPPTATKKWIRQGPAAPDFEAEDVLPMLTTKAVEFIREASQKDRPFFLYLPLNSPHTPILPTKEWKGKSGLGDYGDFVMQTDAAVGPVLEALASGKVAENTLVIFTSDNGCSPAANIQALEKQGHFPHERFRGTKADIWEGGHRVPFLARWPAKVARGSRSDSTICLTDLLATAAEAVGRPLPENAAEDSFSFLPDLLGSGRTKRESTVHHSIHGQFAIRRGPWKLAFHPGSGGWSKPSDAEARKSNAPALQLFNLKEDPAETKNVVGQNEEIVRQLTAEMEAITTNGRSTPGAKQANDVAVDFRKARP